MVSISQGFLDKQNQKDTHLYSKRFKELAHVTVEAVWVKI